MKIQKQSMTLLFTLFMSLFLGSCGSSGDGGEPSGVLGESDGGNSDAGATEGTNSSGNGGTSPIGPVANPSLSARDESIVVNWDTLPSATSYDICQAEEVITDPLNCSVFSGGILHTNMSSPATISGLSNGKAYHFLITPYKEGKAGESTADLTATPNKSAVEQPGGVPGELNLNNGRKLLDTVRADFASYASEEITIKAPDIAENGAVVPITAGFPPEVGSLWLFVENNPHRIATKTDFSKADGSGSVSTRLKMAKTGNIIAAFVDLNGKIIATQKEIQITVGSVGDGENTVGGSAEGEAYTCENVYSPSYRDLEACKTKLGDEALPSSMAKIRAKTEGETTSLKMLMNQPMEPKDYITSVSVIADNTLHSKTFFTPYVSKNPYLASKFPIPTQKLKIKFEATNSRVAETEEFELSTSGAFKPSTSKPESEPESESDNSTTPESADQTPLATSKGCMACHKVDMKVIGPSFKDVAARYEGDASALETLVIKVRDGGKGNWGEIPMPPNSAVSDEDLNTLVTWILGLVGKPWWDVFTS